MIYFASMKYKNRLHDLGRRIFFYFLGKEYI